MTLFTRLEHRCFFGGPATMPISSQSCFGRSAEFQRKLERDFYANHSQRHPPKNRIGLVAREEQFMKELRQERNTKGFSEAFLTRRRFPIVEVETEDSGGSEEVPEAASSPAASSPVF